MNRRKSDNPSMRITADDNELAEILIEGDQHATLEMGLSEDFVVARVLVRSADVHDVMSGGGELDFRASPDACVEQQLHPVASAMRGSILSWATIRCA